jgi:hypothetical protein
VIAGRILALIALITVLSGKSQRRITMQIVIDIPEKYLNSNIIDVTLITGANNTITDVNVENEYVEFQVLPKGHGELIDKDIVIDMMNRGVLEEYITVMGGVIPADG